MLRSVVFRTSHFVKFTKQHPPRSFTAAARPLFTSHSVAKKTTKPKQKHDRKGGTPTHIQAQDVIDQAQVQAEYDNQGLILEDELSKQLSLRTNIRTFETLQVDLPEGRFPVNHLGKVTMKSQRLVVINMASSPGAVEHVMTAVTKSGLGITPQQQGNTVYLPIPIMSREQRERMAQSGKHLVQKFEDSLGKIEKKFKTIIDRAEVEGHTSVDELVAAKNLLIAERRRAVQNANELLKKKQTELLEEIK